MKFSRSSGLLLACLLCVAAVLASADATPASADTGSDAAATAAAAAAASGDAAQAQEQQQQQQQRPPFIVLKPQDSWLLEGCAVALLLTFVANLWLGRRANERLALYWTSEVRDALLAYAACSTHCVLRGGVSPGVVYCRGVPHSTYFLSGPRAVAPSLHMPCPLAAQLVAPGGVLDRNFALLGPGDTPVRALPWGGPGRVARCPTCQTASAARLAEPTCCVLSTLVLPGGRGAAQGVGALPGTRAAPS